ncbi:MAG: hypothetical protein AAF517_23870, partial [Planctomycetota bacterium]
MPTSTDLSTLVSVNPSTPNPEIDGLISGTPPLRTSDPKSFVTKTSYNVAGMVTEIDGPGELIKFTYDEGTDSFQWGNRLRTEVHPKPDDGTEPRITTTLYEPYFNRVRAVISPEGNSPGYAPPNGGAWSADRYLEENVFDFQEGDISTTSLPQMAAAWGIDEDQGAAFAIFGPHLDPIEDSDSLGDLNGDGAHEVGNTIVIRRPAANVFVDPASPSATFVTQASETVYAYNDFGQLKSATDARNNTTEFEYFAESDPDGDGTTSVSSRVLDVTSGADGGGFLKKTINADSSEAEVTYDPLGRKTSMTDGRGNTWAKTFNALDQVVYEKDPRDYETWRLYGWNDQLTEVRRTNSEPSVSLQGVPGAESVEAPIVERFFYDLLLNLVREERAEDRTSEHRYDGIGNRVLTRLPEFATNPSEARSWSFDERNLLFETCRGGTAVYANPLLSASDPAVVDSPKKSTSTTAYDPHGSVVSEINGRGKESTRAYDGLNRLTRSTDPNGNYVDSVRDIAGRVVESKARDSADTLLSRTFYRYDEVGRLFQVDREFFDSTGGLPDGPLTPSDPWVSSRTLFDASGNPVKSVDDNLGVTTRTYDSLGRIKTTVDALGNTSTSFYDGSGNRIRVEETEKDSDGSTLGPFKTWYIFDEINRLTAVVDHLGRTTRRQYDSLGNVVFASDANSSTTNLPMNSLDPSRTDLVGPTINDHGN